MMHESVLNSLQSIVKCLEDTIKVSNVKQMDSENKDSHLLDNYDYDFDNFKELNVFNKVDKENVNKDEEFQSIGKLSEMDLNLCEILKALSSQRKQFYEESMNKLREMSQEIRATYSLKLFVKYWTDQLSSNSKLAEYPDEIIKCLEKMPLNERERIVKLLSNIKSVKMKQDLDLFKSPVKGIDNSISIICKTPASKERNLLFDVNEISPSYIDATMGLDTGAVYRRGHTANMGISVIDYTFRKSNSNSSIDNLSFHEKIDMLFEDGDEPLLTERILDESEDHVNPLDKTIDNIDYSVECVVGHSPILGVQSPQKTSNFPSFLNDTARIPEIEKYTTGDDDDDSVMEVNFTKMIDVSELHSIQGSLVMSRIDSVVGEGLSRAELRETDDVYPDGSVINISDPVIDYSFNRSPIH